MTDCVSVVQSLSQREKNSILHVLQRDEQLRKGQEQKISDLKREISAIRMCSVLRAGDDQSKICLRCRAEMGMLFNRGALCPSCKYKVCRGCQEVMFNGSWLCKLCYKQRQLKWLTGEWAASFEQNPLRKWASGSDLVKSSFQLVPGTTGINIDETPSQPDTSAKGRKVSRNGVGGPEHGRTRVEVPKEGDQLKLSELFNVLRVKKPEEVPVQETQVRRVVTSRKYSESDSDSSSNSDVDVRSTSTAPSVTESELDRRRLDSPRIVESPPPQIVESPLETESPRRPSQGLRVKSPGAQEQAEYRPIPSPRSPKPAVRRKVKSENVEQVQQSPPVKPRTKHGTYSKPNQELREVEEPIAMSRSMEVQSSGKIAYTDSEMSSSVHSDLSVHVAKTRESLDRKHEVEKSKSQVSLDRPDTEPGQDVIVKEKSKEKLRRQSTESSQARREKVTADTQHTAEVDKRQRHSSDRASENNIGADIQVKKSTSKSEISVKSHTSDETLQAESVHLDQGQEEADRKSFDNSSVKSFGEKSKGALLLQKDESNQCLPMPRAGSPYSVSMDSLPSSHPSPSLLRSSFSSNAESSDTDSINRLCAENIPEKSSSPAKSEDDFVVEQISKVHFKRVSKKAGQLGILAKHAKSPNKKRIPGSRDSPQTISECLSQDDSGNVSGGSQGTTPEHRRTDSSYSQSSIPSTLSTVTDDDEDIDRAVARVKRQVAGTRDTSNLLSVFGDSRESLASYYSDAGDIAHSTIPVTGEILFSLNYNYKTSMLEVGIKQCRDIAMADSRRRRSDPYVKTYLLPDRTRGGKRKTKVKKHTVNPTFDETLKYSITKSELENRTLWVTVWHNDRFGRNIFLGEVTINFDYYKFEDPFPRWYPLQERMDAPPASMLVYKGDLSLSIRFVAADKLGASPATATGKHKKEQGVGRGQLQVKVKEARNLTAVKSNGFSDPFCKGYLLPERHKSSKQKTAVIKKDCNPVWNHTFVFEDVTLAELRERCLDLTVWDYEKLASNDFLGGVRLNLGTGLSQGKPVDWMDARGEEMSMWQAMLDRPNVWIDGALILRPNMDKRKF